MKRLVLVCMCMMSFAMASYAYVASVDITNVNGSLSKEDPTKTFTAFKEQFPSELFLVSDFTISNVAFWTNGSWLRLAGSDAKGSGTMTLKTADGTIFSFYSFGARNSCNKKGTFSDDGTNHVYCVEVTSPDNQPTQLHRADGDGTKTFSSNAYKSQSFTISAKNSSYGPNRVELSDFKFRVKIPELVQANQSASVDLVKIDRVDAGKGITHDAKLSFVVADPIVSNSTDKNEIAKYYSIQLANATGNKWEISSMSIGDVDKSGKATLEIVVRYTDASSELLGNFTSELVVRPVNNVTYDVVSPLEIKTKLNISVGATISNTLEWNIPVTNYIDDTYTIGSGEGKCYKNANSTATLGAPTVLSQQPSEGYVAVVEIANNQLKMVGEGTAILHYVQSATGDYSASSLDDITIKVVKHIPTFSINNGDLGNTLYVNREYKNLISSDNKEIDFSLKVDDADAPFVEVLSQGSVKTGSNVKNSVTVHVSQPASKHYYAKDEDFSFTIEYNPQHVGTLCDNITEELFNDPDFYVNKSASHKSVVWGGANGIQFGGTGGGSGSSYDDEVVLHFIGTPDVITWETKGKGTFTFAWSADNTLNSYTTISSSGTSLPANAQYIKISYVGNGNDGLSYVSKLCIKEKVGIDVDPKILSLTAINGQVPTGVINVRPSNLETITLTINSEDFVLRCGAHSIGSSITLDYTDGLGIDCSPMVPVEIQYVGDYASAVGKTAQVDITDGNGHTATVSINIQSIAENEYGVPVSIYASMATTTGIETGTEHKTNNAHPYHLKQSIDLTGAFAGGAACFDKLYIFGVTKGYTSAGVATQTVNQYSKTPCYIYTKNGDHYDFEQYVENMNSDTKSIGVNVAANGQKLYFTGWCPYASAGYLPSDIGVFHIKGGAGAKVDIYLDNCYLYARSKTINHKYDADETQAKTSFGDYPTGSGGAYVFETTSTNSGSPFTPIVHLRGENVLRSTHGNRVHVTFLNQTKNATQISSPIHMYTSSTGQYETLTIDDKWPTNASGTETENVNGSLQLTKLTSNSPSIDLGNEHSVVNFNGGRVHLQNALPMSTAYSSTLAISWRSYSQYGLTIYGIGTDQTSGEVNFNDGTISATPIDQTSWSKADAFKGYYWDNESMKCPKNTHINGGSYNCNIWACSSFDDKGSSVTDKNGTSLCKKKIKISGSAENGMAIFDFPYSERGEDGQTLESYYKNAGFLYGHNSIAADDKDSVNLMLPCSYIGAEAVVSKIVIPWAMCVPALSAGAGNNSSKDFGGDIIVSDDATHEVNNFVWTRIDDNMKSVIGGGKYKSPEYGATISFRDKSDDAQNYYSQVSNTDEYSIQNELHIIVPAVADNWMTFTAPFDVKKVYVLESYPDSILQTKSRNEALQLQATANVDFAYFMAFYVLGVEPMSTSPLSMLYSSWLSYEYGQDTLSTGFLEKDAQGKWLNRAVYEKKYRGKRELVAYNGKNSAKANFYAYTAGDTWQLNSSGDSVVPIWNYINVGDDGILFKKGQTYSLLFPYCVGCWTDEEKESGRNYWDYWSGKLLIFAGDGPQTVYGKNHQNELLSATAATNTVSISGNSTFSDITSTSKDIWTFGNDIGDESFSANSDEDEVTIEPTTAFLINGIQSKAGAAPKRINIRSGAVTYEDNADTEAGVPTIAGGRSLIVNSVAGGIEVIPVVAQQVSVYGSAGQLVATDYLTAETTIALPTGIYIVRGEKEMVKVVVRL